MARMTAANLISPPQGPSQSDSLDGVLGPGVAGAIARHIGLYAYRVSFLRAYRALAPSPLETIEALEQLRALWHGHRIAVLCTDDAPPAGVDTPADLERVRRHDVPRPRAHVPHHKQRLTKATLKTNAPAPACDASSSPVYSAAAPPSSSSSSASFAAPSSSLATCARAALSCAGESAPDS